MSFLDRLKNSLSSSAPVYHEFLNNYPKDKEGIHAFFEGNSGDDVSFYKNFLLGYLPIPTKLKTYECDEKGHVYDLYKDVTKYVESADNKAITLFFVDKDLSDFLDEEYIKASNIFVTDFYSIENYLVSVEMLERVWEEIFHFKKQKREKSKIEKQKAFDYIQQQFLTQLEQFYQFATLLMGWAIYLRRNVENLRLHLNNIKLSKICKLTDELEFEFNSKQVIQEIEKMCQINTPSGYLSEVSILTAELSAYNPKAYIRGKFELWFFVEFINKLQGVIGNLPLTQKLSVSLSINETNAIQILGPRLQIPPSLKTFLDFHLDGFR